MNSSSIYIWLNWASLVAQLVKNLPAMQGTPVRFLSLKKEFIGPGLHLRPVHADHAQPPYQGTLSSVFTAYENNNRRIRPPPDRGTLKIGSRLLIA